MIEQNSEQITDSNLAITDMPPLEIVGWKPVVGVGDNHGCDPKLLVEDLIKYEVLDANGRLSPTFKGIVIQMGDTVDRGAYSFEVFTFWRELQSQDPSRVIRLLGNHELCHLTNTSWEISAAKIEGLQKALIEDILSGKILAAWHERDILYTHAGLDISLFPEYEGKELSFICDDLNRRLVEAVKTIDFSRTYSNSDEVFGRDPIFSRGPFDNGYRGGIFWARQHIENDSFRQVVGHTPQWNGIRAEPGARVKYIDAGRIFGENGSSETQRKARQFMVGSDPLRYGK